MTIVRVGLRALRNPRPKAGHKEPGFWTAGTRTDRNGLLFGETPPPPGQSRKWEGWETTWYSMLIGTPIILYVGYKAKPNSSIEPWASAKARAQLKAEGIEL